MAGLVEGWPGIRGLLSRIVRVRFGLRWYAVIFGLPVALCAIAVAIMAAFGQVTSAPSATLPIIPAFLISLLAGTLIQTWLFNRTKGSVFAQMLFHATVNTVGAGLVFPLFKGAAFVAFWYIYALLWLAAAVALAASRRGDLKSPIFKAGPAVAG